MSSEEIKELISKILLTSSEDESDSSQEDEIFYTDDEKCQCVRVAKIAIVQNVFFRLM